MQPAPTGTALRAFCPQPLPPPPSPAPPRSLPVWAAAAAAASSSSSAAAAVLLNPEPVITGLRIDHLSLIPRRSYACGGQRRALQRLDVPRSVSTGGLVGVGGEGRDALTLGRPEWDGQWWCDFNPRFSPPPTDGHGRGRASHAPSRYRWRGERWRQKYFTFCQVSSKGKSLFVDRTRKISWKSFFSLISPNFS